MALRAIALRPAAPVAPLIHSQLKSGAWTAFPSAGVPNAFHTALALLALRSHHRSSDVARSVERAFAWLDSLEGAESHWLWKWKFRYFDRQVRFDVKKSGWPWVDGTVSWVAPTAMTLLAHTAWRRESPRVPIGVDMLRDRACTAGGWNAGNSVVFGVHLDPHPDFTAMALLALRAFVSDADPIVEKGLAYLGSRIRSLTSPYSLAWTVLALTAYDSDDAAACRQCLSECLQSEAIERMPVRTLALCALALKTPPFTFQEDDP